MSTRSCLLMIVVLLLTSCTRMHHHAPTQPLPQNGPITPFTRVQIKGNINVTLSTGRAHPTATLQGDPRDRANVQMSVIAGTLHINVKKKYPRYGSLSADIGTHYLTSFDYQGKGAITGKNIRSGLLDITLANKGTTQLTGQMALRHLSVKSSGSTKIEGLTGHHLTIMTSEKPHVQLSGITEIDSIKMKDSSWLSLYWVKGHTLKVRQYNQSFLQLAGIVDQLDAKLSNHARFNGRYLRGRRVFVKTMGNSVADISAITAQHTLALDSSNIYFHLFPDFKADFMADNGSVLDLREWELPFMEEPTRYNH